MRVTVIRLVARVLMPCAVLVGVAFMHSLAAGAMGCSGGASAGGAAMAPTEWTDHENPVAHSGVPASPVLDAPMSATGHGAVCVSTPPRTHLAVPAPPQSVMLGMDPSPAVAPVRAIGTAAAQPRAGPDRLIDLCVSRT